MYFFQAGKQYVHVKLVVQMYGALAEDYSLGTFFEGVPQGCVLGHYK